MDAAADARLAEDAHGHVGPGRRYPSGVGGGSARAGFEWALCGCNQGSGTGHCRDGERRGGKGCGGGVVQGQD